MTQRSRTFLLSAVLFLLFSFGGTAEAQPVPRYGIGFNGMLSTTDGAGIGLRGRVSVPLNADLSIAGDLGFTGFVFDGRRDATYLFNPQLSAIVTMPPRGDGATYILAGVGIYAPMTNQDDSESGPTVHFGIGRVQQLRETVLFYEIDPALILGLDSVDLALPFRIGVILP